MSGRDTGIAQRLRNAGLRVVECGGWQTAGSTDFDPRGSVNHHTAGPASGATPSLNTCIHGRPDLPGPLCNVFQSREPDGRDIAYVVAAGRANHAGEGGWRGLSGNRSVYGLEIEHTGTSALPDGRIQIAARIHAAMFSGDPAYVCQHYEWTTRKIDAATNVPGDAFRNRVAAARHPEPPDKGDDMPTQYLVKLDGRPELLLVSAARDSVLWVRDSGAKVAIQTQIALDGGNPDVQSFETDGGDGLGKMVRNLTMVGEMPPGYRDNWPGPHLPGE